MRIKAATRLILVALLILGSMFMTGCGFTYVINSSHRLDRDDAREFIIQKTEVEPITEINIHTGIAEVEIVESDQFYVEIDYLYWEEEPDYSLKDGKLFFDDSDSFPNSYSINFNLDNQIKIYIPKDSRFASIRIEDASGDVDISGFISDELEVSVSYGDFTMKEATALDTEITLSSGSSSITDFQANKLDFTNSYGNADFTNINQATTQADADITYDRFLIAMSSGDVDIRGLNSNEVKITNSYGDIILSELTAQELELKLSSGSCKLTEGDVTDTYISNSYGNVTVNMIGAEKDYSLDLDTSYGKIKVGENAYDEHYQVDTGIGRKLQAELSSGDVTVGFTKE